MIDLESVTSLDTGEEKRAFLVLTSDGGATKIICGRSGTGLCVMMKISDHPPQPVGYVGVTGELRTGGHLHKLCDNGTRTPTIVSILVLDDGITQEKIDQIILEHARSTPLPPRFSTDVTQPYYL